MLGVEPLVSAAPGEALLLAAAAPGEGVTPSVLLLLAEASEEGEGTRISGELDGVVPGSGETRARGDSVAVTVEVVEGEAPNDSEAVFVDEEVAVSETDAVVEAEAPRESVAVAVPVGEDDGSTASGEPEAVIVIDGDCEAPKERVADCVAADEAEAVMDGVAAADKPADAEAVAAADVDVVGTAVPAADCEMVALAVREAVALPVVDGVCVNVMVFVAVAVCDQLADTVAAAVTDDDAPPDTGLVAVDVRVPVYEGVAATDADTDALRVREVDAEVVGDTDGVADGSMQEVSTTAPAAPAEPAVPPPT